MTTSTNRTPPFPPVNGVAAAPVQSAAPRGPAPLAAPVRTAAPRVTVQQQLSEGITRPQQRVLDSIAWWAALDIPEPTRPQVAAAAKYAIGGNFDTLVSSLVTVGLVERRSPGTLSLTSEGLNKATAQEAPASSDELHDRVAETLSNPQTKLFKAAIAAHPEELTRAELAERSGYNVGGNFDTLVSSLVTREILERSRPGFLRASEWLFV